ncbi:hypothetical protein CYMTET_15091 [Cymbomonas tetramitiformis]|uniref:Uncharacterized protein n=1 Tax=Cymbomonas tetramitiformis TaxID=36881 RepID=A0AAE0GEP4_9CHLO|nr:hypothetical protein CYMTET_15091 [Cymbomonas tetramitiformis]
MSWGRDSQRVLKVAAETMALSSSPVPEEPEVEDTEQASKWRRVRQVLEDKESGNPLISAYRMKFHVELESQIKHKDPNGQKQLGRMSRLEDVLQEHKRKSREKQQRSGERLKTAENSHAASTMRLERQLESAQREWGSADRRDDQLVSLQKELKQAQTKLKRSASTTQSLKGKLRWVSTRITPTMVKTFVDKRLRPGKSFWSFQVMQESATLRNLGLSANVIPKVCTSVQFAYMHVQRSITSLIELLE